MAGSAGALVVWTSRLVTRLVLVLGFMTHALLLVAVAVTVVKLNGYTDPQPFLPPLSPETPRAS